MDVSFNCDNIILEKEDILKEVFNVNETDSLDNILNAVAKASFSEYIKMLSGAGMPNRADEAKQIRLYYLILEHYNIIPNDSQISSLFQITLTQSKTLVKNTVSRYRVKLKTIIQSTINAIIENKYNEINEDYNNDIDASDANLEDYILNSYYNKECIQFTIDSEFLKLEINSEISKIKPTLELFVKQKNSMCTYILHRESVVKLFKKYGFIDA